MRYIGITHYTPSAFGDLAGIIEREEIDLRPIALFESTCARRKADAAAGGRARRRCDGDRPFGGGGLFRQVRGKALPSSAAEAGCASWAQFFLKYIVAASCGHLRDSGDQRPGASRRRSRSGTRADAGRCYAPPDGRGIRCEARSLGAPMASPPICPPGLCWVRSRWKLSEQAPSVCFLRRVPVFSRVDASPPAVGTSDVTAESSESLPPKRILEAS